MKYMIFALIMLLLASSFWYRWFTGLNRAYNKALDDSMNQINKIEDLITEEELESLPVPLRNYMNFVGVVGTPRVTHYYVDFSGSFRMDRERPWADVTAKQYSFVELGRRLFSIGMFYKGLPINGLHYFHEGNAYMTIKILDMITVGHHEGELMKKGETVTFFNDACVMAPGSLLDMDIEWEAIDDHQIRGTLTNDGITVSASLYFDDDGKLINFITYDRYAANNDGTYDNIPWSTPIHSYRESNGMTLPYEGEAIWHYEDQDFSYIKLEIQEIVMNPVR